MIWGRSADGEVTSPSSQRAGKPREAPPAGAAQAIAPLEAHLFVKLPLVLLGLLLHRLVDLVAAHATSGQTGRSQAQGGTLQRGLRSPRSPPGAPSARAPALPAALPSPLAPRPWPVHSPEQHLSPPHPQCCDLLEQEGLERLLCLPSVRLLLRKLLRRLVREARGQVCLLCRAPLLGLRVVGRARMCLSCRGKRRVTEACTRAPQLARPCTGFHTCMHRRIACSARMRAHDLGNIPSHPPSPRQPHRAPPRIPLRQLRCAVRLEPLRHHACRGLLRLLLHLPPPQARLRGPPVRVGRDRRAAAAAPCPGASPPLPRARSAR